MRSYKHIYSFTYDTTEVTLSRLESKYIFGEVDTDKLLFSNLTFEPSHSSFVKSRLDIITSSVDYPTLIKAIKAAGIVVEDFKVEYLVFDGDPTDYADRLDKLKDIGYSIEGNPDYYKPKVTYALCKHDQTWYFGQLIKDKFAWWKHQKKPRSYSNSIGMNTAKTLVNIASRGDKQASLLDACCGVGTIMLEACFAGYQIEGCDINWKICRNARANLTHFGYGAQVHRADVKDIENSYESVIVDLPYNLLSKSSDEQVEHIVTHAARLSDRLIIVSTADISGLINSINFSIRDQCRVGKPGKASFARSIWVCEKVAEGML